MDVVADLSEKSAGWPGEEEEVVSVAGEMNKALVRRFFEAHAKGDLDTLRELLAPTSSITCRFPAEKTLTARATSTRAHLKTLYASKTDLSPTTIRHLHAAIHKALDEAVADNLIARNVATNIKLPKMRKKEIHPLNPDQAKAFLEAARGDRYEALYVLAIHYGLRQGELLGLKWSDLQGNTLQVRRTMSEARVERIEEETKNGKGRRIEHSGKAVEALRSHR